MTSTTASSTSADDAQRERRLPPDLLSRTNALLDELDELRAKQPDHKHARDMRTAWAEAHIEDVIRTKRAPLEDRHQRFRVSAVLKFLKLLGHKKLPTRAVVQRVLIEQGLYVIK